ncbi:MAG TPA: hypothetical protein VJP77_05650 [Planctomycetota bacterium]|nr:hypothetical protein [Planctomycetota bacterium]
MVKATGESAAAEQTGDPAKGDGQGQGHETAPFSFKTADDFNAAVTSRLKPLKGTIEKQSESIAALQKTIEDLTGKLAGADDAPEKGKGKGGDAAPRPDPKVTAMEKQLKELQAERDTERAEAQEIKKQQAFEKAAQAAGFVDTADIVYDHFARRVKLAEDGEYYVGEAKLADALKEFGSTDKGKRLLPPKPAPGSTAMRAGDKGGPAAPKVTLQDAMMHLVKST